MTAIVETANGRLEGREEAGVRVFRGIPYARPPLGERRFRAPEPPEPWSGVRDAGSFGSSAPQSAMLLPLPGMDVGPTDEDCLTLNVWTPGTDDARRPVLFWIHGGGFVIGSGSQVVYDGAALARRGDVVVVTINYRLGPLGFLFLADLCPGLEGAVGNAGLRDQVAALGWVQENIARFGGDPQNVTIFGESAGGMSVGTLLGVPSARGLFQRAIPQSGAAHNIHDRESATQAAAAFLEVLGLSPADAAAQLREVPTQKLLDTQQQTLFKLGTSGSLGILPFSPMVDGDLVPRPALESIRAGDCRGVDVLVGTCRDEWKLFGMLESDLATLDEEGLVRKFAERIPGVDARALVDTYKGARGEGLPSDPRSLFFAIETDRIFRIPAVRLAEAQGAHHEQVFMYRVDWESPAFGGALGACHAVELPFVFGSHGLPGADQFVGKGPEADDLAERMMDAWIAFAREGEPEDASLPDWEPYASGSRPTMIFGRDFHVLEDPDAAERAFWDGLL